ncbi:hypothetical protein B7463_g9893, partial [Scytalidium lignicola]
MDRKADCCARPDIRSGDDMNVCCSCGWFTLHEDTSNEEPSLTCPPMSWRSALNLTWPETVTYSTKIRDGSNIDITSHVVSAVRSLEISEDHKSVASSILPLSNTEQVRKLSSDTHPFISPGQIRLLYLSPIKPGTEKHPIRVSFKTVDLVNKPEYEALSYTWRGEDDGDAQDKPLYIKGWKNAFLITPNCDAALRKLQQSGTGRWLWVDSICINQNDSKEKNHQVAIMHRIYSMANFVHIYLGPEFEGDKPGDSIWFISRSTDEIKSIVSGEEGKQGIKRLFAKRYFKRSWVIQEVTLSKNTMVHWGNTTALWSGLKPEKLRKLNEMGLKDSVPQLINFVGELQPSSNTYVLQLDDKAEISITLQTLYEKTTDSIFLVDSNSLFHFRSANDCCYTVVGECIIDIVFPGDSKTQDHNLAADLFSLCSTSFEMSRDIFEDILYNPVAEFYSSITDRFELSSPLNKALMLSNSRQPESTELSEQDTSNTGLPRSNFLGSGFSKGDNETTYILDLWGKFLVEVELPVIGSLLVEWKRWRNRTLHVANNLLEEQLNLTSSRGGIAETLEEQRNYLAQYFSLWETASINLTSALGWRTSELKESENDSVFRLLLCYPTIRFRKGDQLDRIPGQPSSLERYFKQYFPDGTYHIQGIDSVAQLFHLVRSILEFASRNMVSICQEILSDGFISSPYSILGIAECVANYLLGDWTEWEDTMSLLIKQGDRYEERKRHAIAITQEKLVII